jgi:hypothetical protein
LLETMIITHYGPLNNQMMIKMLKLIVNFLFKHFKKLYRS